MTGMTLTLAAIAVTAASTAALAQHGHGTGGAPGHLRAQACAEEFDKVVSDGRGFGMAFAADQNGYPGPMHVLELKEELGLTPDQVTQVQALMHAMFADSRPKSARLLEAEARLRTLFTARRASEDTVRAAAGEVERARGEVRLVHLLAHLKTREVLTESQRQRYHAARWPGR